MELEEEKLPWQLAQQKLKSICHNFFVIKLFCEHKYIIINNKRVDIAQYVSRNNFALSSFFS